MFPSVSSRLPPMAEIATVAPREKPVNGLAGLKNFRQDVLSGIVVSLVSLPRPTTARPSSWTPSSFAPSTSRSVTTCCAAWTRCAGAVPTCTRWCLMVTPACVPSSTGGDFAGPTTRDARPAVRPDAGLTAPRAAGLHHCFDTVGAGIGIESSAPPPPSRFDHRDGACVRPVLNGARSPAGAGSRDPGRRPSRRGAREQSSATAHPLSIAPEDS